MKAESPWIDLTLRLTPTLAGVATRPARRLETDGWNALTLELYSHCGTHIDAPLHFGVPGPTIDDLPLPKLMGPAWRVSLPALPEGYLIQVDDLGPAATGLQPGEGLLLHTDWSERLGTPAYRDGLPRISEELAHWCVAHRVNFLGVEPPSIANVNDLPEVTRIHRILLAGQVTIIEGLCQLHRLHSQRVYVIALPLRIGGGDGAPARVIAQDR